MRFLKGISGAPCTKHLKRYVREAHQRAGDIHVFGMSADEMERIALFEEHFPDLSTRWVLAYLGLTKADCLEIIKAAGIELPAMYRQGYNNNNCIGCVKGGKAYWQKIKHDFPATFEKMARLERSLGYSLLDCFLDQLPDQKPPSTITEHMSCGVICDLDK